MAAFNRRMAEAAGRVADGVIGHGLFTDRWWNEVVRPAVSKGVAERSRDSDPVEQGWVITAIDDAAPERAIRDARRMIAFYLTVKTYDPFVEYHGWQESVEAIRRAFRRGDTDGMVTAVPDDMLSAIAVCGTASQGQQMLLARKSALAHDISYFAPPSFLVSERRAAAYARASLGLIDALR
jgi:hypothetical protein